MYLLDTNILSELVKKRPDHNMLPLKLKINHVSFQGVRRVNSKTKGYPRIIP